MHDLRANPNLTHALAHQRDLLAEAEHARRLGLAEPARSGLAAALRHVASGLGTRRLIPSTPTAASAAT